ncbi:MAG: zf-HC2 domain-containing protein [Myxococcales bacterium]|nr:zf-HC2 domain-containing protein [Myxococcales bacterium]
MAKVPDPRLEGGLWCHEVLEALQGYVADTLSSQERDAVEAHLRRCDQCARFGGAYSEVVVALRRELTQPEALDRARADRLADRLRSVTDEP